MKGVTTGNPYLVRSSLRERRVGRETGGPRVRTVRLPDLSVFYSTQGSTTLRVHTSTPRRPTYPSPFLVRRTLGGGEGRRRAPPPLGLSQTVPRFVVEEVRVEGALRTQGPCPTLPPRTSLPDEITVTPPTVETTGETHTPSSTPWGPEGGDYLVLNRVQVYDGTRTYFSLFFSSRWHMSRNRPSVDLSFMNQSLRLWCRWSQYICVPPDDS